VYSIPEYNKLDPVTKREVDSKLYDKVAGYYTKYGQKPPSRTNWLALDTPLKISSVKETLHAPIKKDDPGVIEPQVTAGSDWSWSKRLGYYNTKFLEGAAEFYSGTGKLLTAPVRAADKFSIRSGSGEIDVSQFGKHFGEKVVKEAHEFEEANYPHSMVNREMSTKILGGVSSFIPTMLAFELSPGGRLANVEKSVTENGESAYKISGVISKAGGLTKFLEGNPIGRSIVRMTKGAADGYFISTTQTGKPSTGEAVGWGVAEAGIPAVGAVSKTTFDAATKFYTKIADTWGAEFSGNMAALAAKELAGELKRTGISLTDPLVRKLTEANSKILNDFAKEYYNAQGYNLLPRAQKVEVNKEINRAIQQGQLYPLIHDPQGAAVQIEQRVQNMIKGDVAAETAFQKLQSMSEKSGLGKTLTPAAKSMGKELEESLGRTPAVKASEISIGKVQKRLPVPKTEKVSSVKPPKQGIKPGAAVAKSAEFNSPNPSIEKALSLNIRPEKSEDWWTLKYYEARTGRIKPELANNIIRTFEAHFPDETERIGRLNGLIEHMEKLVRTGHHGVGEPGIFRSGRYITDDLRDFYDMPKTEYQEELDEEDKFIKKVIERSK